MRDPIPPDPPETGSRRVLLVEDNEAACKGLTRVLEAYGFQVTAVHDGAAALEALGGGSDPDFLLTDLQLPDLDGREVARRARAQHPGVKVALITGWDLEVAADRPDAWGIDWVLTKPLDVAALIAKMAPPAERKAAAAGLGGRSHDRTTAPSAAL